jgi:uncharacterized protein YkwD
VRLVLPALLAVLATAAPAVAQDAPRAPAPADDPLLVPPGRCAGDDAPAAHHRTQRLAMHCLIRGLRRRAGVPIVRSNVPLRHSATYKARRIAACRVFTHAPCGDELSVPFLQADVTRHGPWTVGEDLGWGAGRRATARDVVGRWLRSPTHRAVLVDERFTHLGVRRRRLRMRGAPVGAVLWVAHLGRRARG